MHKIMIVDDEVVINMQLEERLKFMGYEIVGRAYSGKEAIELAKILRPDLILMDIVMPGELDGIGASEIIKKELDIPIVFLTAYGDDKYIKRAKNVEPFGYIIKPYKEYQIKATIEIALQKKEMEHRLLKEKELLLRETHHRVKNNLQVISSLLNLQARYIKDKEALEAFKESRERVRLIALIHAQLYQSEELSQIDFAEYIQSLTAHLFRLYGVDLDVIELKVNVDDVFLGVETAIPCGLIINELVSNSLKYAFPEGRDGEIRIELRLDDGRCILIVSDNGIGLPEDLDFRNTESLGLQLVNTLAEDQLQGKIKLDRTEGTEFQIKFKTPNHK